MGAPFFHFFLYSFLYFFGIFLLFLIRKMIDLHSIFTSHHFSAATTCTSHPYTCASDPFSDRESLEAQKTMQKY